MNLKLQEIIPAIAEPERHRVLNEYMRWNLGEFKEVERHSPVKNQVGALSTGEAFWLYCLVRDLKPTTIIESGTLYGWSLWFLEAAVQGKGQIHSFDPGDFEPEKKSDAVKYHKCDWMEQDMIGEGHSSFVFFDDHQNHDERLTQAMARGVRDIVFHDNYESLGHSHIPIRYCPLQGVQFAHTFECLREDVDPVFGVGKNAQTYRWLTWLRLRD